MKSWLCRHFERPRAAQSFVPQIDGLRCVAILSVIGYHVQGYAASRLGHAPHAKLGWLHEWLAHGWVGVPLFFALSGYIIARPFFSDRPPAPGAYFLRRLSRLEPPYFINLLVVFALKVLVLGIAGSALLPHLLASLVYLHGPIYGEHSLVNGVAWSLEVEWQFYVLAPLLLYLVRRFTSRSMTVLTAIALVFGGLAYVRVDSEFSRAALSVIRYFGFFLGGVGVAFGLARGAFDSMSGFAADALAVLSVGALCFALHRGAGWEGLLPSLMTTLLLGGLRGTWTSRLLAWWPVPIVGGMCYTIYLYHFFVVSAAGRLLPAFVFDAASPNASLGVALLILGPIVILACMIPYKLIERPFMVWRPGSNTFRAGLFQAVFARDAAASGSDQRDATSPRATPSPERP